MHSRNYYLYQELAVLLSQLLFPILLVAVNAGVADAGRALSSGSEEGFNLRQFAELNQYDMPQKGYNIFLCNKYIINNDSCVTNIDHRLR